MSKLKKQKQKKLSYKEKKKKLQKIEKKKASKLPLFDPMALPLSVLLVSLLLLIAVPDIYATFHHGVHHAVGSRAHHRIVLPKHHRPKFKPGPWKQAHATFYEGGPGSFGMNYECWFVLC